jgi:hypothetical protein
MRMRKSMRLQRPIRMKRSLRVKKSARVKTSPFVAGKFGAWAILLVMTGVMGAAMLIAARQPSEPTDTAAVNARAEHVAAAQEQAKKAAASTAPAARVVPVTTRPADATAPGAADVESATKAIVPAAAPVTITGCLDRADETFRLKDTTGAEAPKSRSWKSGFLKKGAASIALVDAPKKLKLPEHVGQRVSVTGLLEGREMQVLSLQRVAASCN